MSHMPPPIRRKRRKIEPKEPPRTLAAIEAILGDDTDLVQRYVEALFKVAAKSTWTSAPHLVRNAGTVLAWTYQSMVKRKVKPWRRSWNWQPDDRERIGAEIAAKSLQSPDLADIVRIEIEMLVYLAFDMVGPAFAKSEPFYSRTFEFSRYMAWCLGYVECKRKQVYWRFAFRSFLLLQTCYFVGRVILAERNLTLTPALGDEC